MIANPSMGTLREHRCPICRSADTWEACELPGMPVHVGRLWPTAAAARRCPRGDILLSFCRRCGMLWNRAFDSARVVYDGEYDNSLFFSAVHRRLAEEAALRLIQQHALYHREIIEIGCGSGEFLTLLCELGNNRGIGFDPSCPPQGELREDVRFIRARYGPEYADLQADLISSRYLLEHLAEPVGFLRQLHSSLRGNQRALVYFEVPNAWLVFHQGMIWDLIYEHFANYCRWSLVRAFQQAGFSVCEVGEACDGQVLWIEARPTSHAPTIPASAWDDRAALEPAVRRLREDIRRLLFRWQCRLTEFQRRNCRVVVWGAGAKGISFLNLLDTRQQVSYVVDINPRKRGRFIPCMAQEIVEPAALRTIRPEVVLVMNPLYESEIRETIRGLSLDAEVICV